METKEELDLLHAEILNLFNYIQRVRKEVAAITRVDEGNGRFDNMSDQLDAIVQATAEATNSIMEIVEQNSDTLQKIRDKTEDPEIRALLDEVENNSSNIFEACTFQDITGQRINKVVSTLTFIEERLASLKDTWGPQVADLIAEADDEEEDDDDRRLLNGPALSGEGIQQDDIDRLLSGSDDEAEAEAEAEAQARAEPKATAKPVRKDKAATDIELNSEPAGESTASQAEIDALFD